jgi:eukaryotic-like serine/threonine-protein kinase
LCRAFMVTEAVCPDGSPDALDDLLGTFFESPDPGSGKARTDFLARHPAYAGQLQDFFADLDRMNRLTAPLRSATLSSASVTSQPVHSLPPGQVLGDFELLEVLGEGGMGVVYRARQVSLNRQVALKMIRAARIASPGQVARFRNEAETVASLDHPNVVPIYEVGEVNGQLFYSMKLIEGGNLGEHLARFQAEPRRAGQVIRDIALAIHHAHQHGILHRDLKPSNVLLDTVGRPHIVDFGLAKWIRVDTELTQSGLLVGTPSYMAPEQAEAGQDGRRTVTTATDVYGIGAVLYALLTGGPPFAGGTLLETLEQVRSHDPAAPRRLRPQMPRDLETICLKCLAKEPARRYVTAGELAEELERFLDGRPIRARPVGALGRLMKWAQRQRALAALVAVSAVSLVTFIVLVMLHNFRLQAEVRRAENSETEAKGQRLRANANYHEARETIGRMLNRLEAKRLAGLPQVTELRRDLLEDSLTFYQRVLGEQDSPEPDVRSDAAQAFHRTAVIQAGLGRPAAAQENFSRSVALLEELAAQHPDVLSYQNNLAWCYNDYGTFLGTLGKNGQKKEQYQKSLGVLERLALVQPNDPEVRANLAQIHHLLGIENGVTPEAEAHYTQALALTTELLKQFPGAVRDLNRVGDHCLCLGSLYAQTGRLLKAEDTYQLGEVALKALVQDHPQIQNSGVSLASLYVNWSYLAKEASQAGPALERLGRAIQLMEAFFQQEPNAVEARFRLVRAHGARAQLYERLGRYAEAVKDWDRLIEVEIESKRPYCRLCRMAALARAGSHGPATAEAASLLARPNLPDEWLYELACVYALCVGPARSDGQLQPPERAKLAARYSAQALALLERLRKNGYFRDQKRVKNLVEDGDLSLLPGLSEFKESLKESSAEKAGVQ